MALPRAVAEEVLESGKGRGASSQDPGKEILLGERKQDSSTPDCYIYEVYSEWGLRDPAVQEHMHPSRAPGVSGFQIPSGSHVESVPFGGIWRRSG